MNICFLNGKIKSKIDFDFLYNNDNISIVHFYIETCIMYNFKNVTLDKFLVYAYDDIADEIYSKYKKGDIITIIGCLEMDRIRIIEIEDR